MLPRESMPWMWESERNHRFARSHMSGIRFRVSRFWLLNFVLKRYNIFSHPSLVLPEQLPPGKLSRVVTMFSNKTLPPTPSPLTNTANSRNARIQQPTTYSSEMYAQLLEQENEQVRLKNQQLQLRIRCLETKVDADKEHRRASTQEANDALKCRDKLVGEIVETIISTFPRYKQIVATETQDGSAEITIYSQFDDSPI